jgi:hypothetical protein
MNDKPLKLATMIIIAVGVALMIMLAWSGYQVFWGRLS